MDKDVLLEKLDDMRCECPFSYAPQREGWMLFADELELWVEEKGDILWQTQKNL